MPNDFAVHFMTSTNQIPIATPTAAQEKQVKTLISQVLAAKATSAATDTSRLERQMHELAYGLHGLKPGGITLSGGAEHMTHKSDPALEMWPAVTQFDAEALVHLAVPYVRWMNPDLVTALAADNDKHQLAWESVFRRAGIPSDLYVWPGSTCIFPGVRRKPGKGESIAIVADKLRFDQNGNRLAHRVWEQLGTKVGTFKTEREGYELVHLLPHQPAEWQKLFKQQPACRTALPSDWQQRLATNGLPALFSNPANMCFLPAVMVRPTDGNSLLRQVLWKKALDLFGRSALLPPRLAEPFEQWLQTLPSPAKLNWSQRYHGDAAHLHRLLKDRHNELKRYEDPTLPQV